MRVGRERDRAIQQTRGSAKWIVYFVDDCPCCDHWSNDSPFVSAIWNPRYNWTIAEDYDFAGRRLMPLKYVSAFLEWFNQSQYKGSNKFVRDAVAEAWMAGVESAGKEDD